ncbi:MAG TPA: phosphoribosylglycinamide formyltransferase [Fervidobacterium sp.]|nr:phosphoribosylglycinamide formyltransferase [Fervidobacterium sp.]HPP17836.1 phosphoribosylglycinamide formyltransferase [Fervidobacterium sp.]
MYRLFRPELSDLDSKPNCEKIPRIVVVASGNGSNFQAIADAINNKQLDAKIECLITDKSCYAIERARILGIESILLDKPWYETFERVIDSIEPTIVVLAGFMRIIPSHIVEKYFPRIINIHPALLPAFPGKEAIKQAFEYGVKVTGITIHFVDSGVDSGPIILQKAIEVEENWDLETVEYKIHSLEHEYYWRAIDSLLKRPFKIKNRKVTWGE